MSMAGELRLDEGGVSALVRELHVHAANSADHTQQADAALAAAAGSLTSSPVADAMARLAGRFRNSSADVETRMTSLGTALTTAATAITATDGQLASDAEQMGQ